MSSTPAPAEQPNHVAKILDAVNISIPRQEIPAAYRVAIASLAIALILISIGYMAMLGVMAWLMIFHTMQAAVSLVDGPYFLFHAPMILLGGLLMLFLIKPVFFRKRQSNDRPIVLTPADEPLLFEFINKLCLATGAPQPARVEVDCNPNAGAQVEGWFGSLRGKNLVLRIGLPLAAGLSLRQFTGVLAHELGHFNQRGGMFGARLIRLLMTFFARVVFQRDQLDEKLVAMRHARLPLARAMYFIAAPLIEAARGVLWVLLMLGELLTCGVLRRMEYDADSVEAHIAGADDFVRTNQLLMFLNIAAQRTHASLQREWQQRRLADNLPALIVANARELATRRDDVLKMLDSQRTHWFDTHPSHNDRAHNVRLQASEPKFTCNASCKNLFADFQSLCRKASSAFYRDVLGDQVDKAALVNTAELIKQHAEQRRAFKAMRRFLHGHIVPSRPIIPGADALQVPDSPNRTADELTSARNTMDSLAPDMGSVARNFTVAQDTIPIAVAKLALCDIFPHAAPVARLRSQAKKELLKRRPELAEAEPKLTQFEQAAQTRLTSALGLLNCPTMASRLNSDAATAAQATPRWIDIGFRLQAHLPAILQLGNLDATLSVLMSAYDPKRPYPPLVQRVLKTSDEMRAILVAIKTDLSSLPYPFEHADQHVSTGDAFVPSLPAEDNVVETHEAALFLGDRFYNLIFRISSHLMELAEQVEASLGIPALPDPPDALDPYAQSEADADARNQRRYWIGYGVRAASGVFMLTVLVWLSIHPLAIPALPWSDAAGGRYRPAPFHTSVQYYATSPQQLPIQAIYSPSQYQPNAIAILTGAQPMPNHSPGQPSSPNYMPTGYTPPGFTAQPYGQSSQPGTPGYRPSTAYQPPSAWWSSAPQTPNYQPPGYRPTGSWQQSPYRQPGQPYNPQSPYQPQPPSPYQPQPYAPPAYQPSPGGPSPGASPGRR